MGQRGGIARRDRLSPQDRRRIAVKAAQTRWAIRDLKEPVEMFAVMRPDLPRPMALFLTQSWAENWVRELSQPFAFYQIIPVTINP